MNNLYVFYIKYIIIYFNVILVPALYPDLSSSASSILQPYFPPAEQPTAPPLPPSKPTRPNSALTRDHCYFYHIKSGCCPFKIKLLSLTHTAEDSVTPSLPVSKTPEFFQTTDGGEWIATVSTPKLTQGFCCKKRKCFLSTVHKQNSLCHQPLTTEHPSPRIGKSSEWDGASQSKSMFLEVGMSRSKVMSS